MQQRVLSKQVSKWMCVRATVPYSLNCHVGVIASVPYALQNNAVFRREQNWVSVSDGSRTDNGSEFHRVLLIIPFCYEIQQIIFFWCSSYSFTTARVRSLHAIHITCILHAIKLTRHVRFACRLSNDHRYADMDYRDGRFGHLLCTYCTRTNYSPTNWQRYVFDVCLMNVDVSRNYRSLHQAAVSHGRETQWLLSATTKPNTAEITGQKKYDER